MVSAALDVVLFLDLAQRCDHSGVQEWLSIYVEQPMRAASRYLAHDLAAQRVRLEHMLRYLRGDELRPHPALDNSC